MSADLLVLMHGEMVGAISKGERERATLVYAPEYQSSAGATPLSLAFPLHTAEHEAGEWLDGLLPPSLDLRDKIARSHNARSQHPVDLLGTSIGMDCAGAVQFVPAHDADDDVQTDRPSGLEQLSEDAIEKGLVALRRGAVAWEQQIGRPLSFSLSGAQTKIALHSTEPCVWHLPYGNAPSTHILKIEIPAFPNNIVVEHLCMTALRNVGIPAARTEIIQFGTQRAISVQRFDRQIDAGGSTRRVHQEDLCQATGTPSHQKQQYAGGPKPDVIADLLWKESPTPSRCVRGFADALAANWVLLADDAHSKNYSVLLSEGSALLAPLYDVCSVAPWRTDEEMPYIQMSMKCGDSFNADRMGADEWGACAAALNLPEQHLLERVEHLSEVLPGAVIEAAEQLPSQFCDEHVERLVEVMEDRPSACRGILGLRLPIASTIGDDHDLGAYHARISARAARQESVASNTIQCAHVGVRSNRRCVLPTGHKPPHRYTA